MSETFTRVEMAGARFLGVNLHGARFVESDLSGVVMRGVELRGGDLDAPWLFNGRSTFTVNGVDVIPLVDAELNRRFPGRADRAADDPASMRSSWAALESTWAATIDRVAAMPPGTAGVAVDGEWTFTQTLRHLILATDMWLRGAILGLDKPFHPIGLMEPDSDSPFDQSVFTDAVPTFEEVLEVRAERLTMVRDFLATVAPEELAAERANPYEPDEPETIRSCLHVILQEEWEHHRYAVRDLDAISASTASSQDSEASEPAGR